MPGHNDKANSLNPDTGFISDGLSDGESYDDYNLLQRQKVLYKTNNQTNLRESKNSLLRFDGDSSKPSSYSLEKYKFTQPQSQ
jgi:hypothetical protein